MQYMVTGVDGKEYGPTDIATLKTWATEGRLARHSMLRDFLSGQTMRADSLPELFPPQAAPMGNVPPAAAPYPRAGGEYRPVGNSVGAGGDFGGGAFAGVLIRAGLGILLFFVMHGIGLLVASSGLITAVQLKSNGSKYGVPALIVSVIAVVVIGIGWALRLSGTHV